MLVSGLSHIYTAVNGSVLVHFVVSFAPPDAADATPDELKLLLTELCRRVDAIVAEYREADLSKLVVCVSPEAVLRDQHFFEIAAEYALTSNLFGQEPCHAQIINTMHLSPMSPTCKTFSGTALSDARAVVSNLFGSHRALVKVIQGYKKKAAFDITTEDIAPLLAQIVELQGSVSFEFEGDEDIVEFTSQYKSLKEVAKFLQGE